MIEKYRNLYGRVIERRSISLRQISELVSQHHSSLSAMLEPGGNLRPRYESLVAVGRAIGVDRLEAFLAVEVLNDPEHYHDPRLTLVCRLVSTLMREMFEPDSDVIPDLNDGEVAMLCSRILSLLGEHHKLIQSNNARSNLISFR
ncbi:hypothetical protein [Sphingobium sp. B11D3A]|uniref:hypothetical protein n=1 Tax=Sphingobium sp. B11D3A TaxID=2940574 RepID=UPI002224EB3B|nr:hypothetical protein [Sphingobium sp. B11D3A]MCW2393579.1 hypothetical protein [Sphingobium sp. B11D3A]